MQILCPIWSPCFKQTFIFFVYLKHVEKRVGGVEGGRVRGGRGGRNGGRSERVLKK
jgi:hypothetical protein